MKVSHNERDKIAGSGIKKFIPKYNYHVDENVIYIEDGKMMSVIEARGLLFESLPDEEILLKFESFKTFFQLLSKSQDVYIWAQLLKTRSTLENFYKIKNNKWVQEFYDFYIDKLSSGDFYKTRYFITIGIPIISNKNQLDLDASLEKMNEVILKLKTALSAFDLEILGVKDDLSEIGSFLSMIVNGQEKVVPLTSTKISDSVPSSDTFFGFDVMQIKRSDNEKDIFGSNFVLKDFPRETKIGQFDFLLKTPYEFILTHSFLPYSLSLGAKKIKKQIAKMNSTKSSEIEKQELAIGAEALEIGEAVFGSFHSVLTVFGDSPKEARENGTKVSGEFISLGGGFSYVKSTYDAPEVFYSHLPMSKNRPLSSERTIANLGCLFSLHNYSYGKEYGNPIGDGTALMPLKSVNDSIYYYNTHYSEPKKNVTGQPVAGHLLLLGATGAGKTTFEGASATFIQRFYPSLFVIDYNCSTELFVRAFGGQFFEFVEGAYTGLNPFQIGNEDDIELMSFLKKWVKRCAIDSKGNPVNDHEAQKIDKAVTALMKMPIEQRRFSLLLQSINETSDLGMRLKKWCGNGSEAWALDSPKNLFNPSEIDKIGFDTTVILNQVNGADHPACEPLLSVLFFYKNRLQKKGKAMLTIVEEFWKPANFPLTQEMIKASLRAGRMKGEMIWLTSQSPDDAVNCGIFSEIVNQTSTKVCLPNPSASYDGYKKIGLTEKEFFLLKKLDRDSRTMLIKQSNSSVFAKMDLYGFDKFLPILSGSKAGITLCKEIMKEIGSEKPDDWIPIFLEKVKLL